MAAEVDVPGLAQADDDDVLGGIVDLADDVLLALAVEMPAEAAGARHAVAQRPRSGALRQWQRPVSSMRLSVSASASRPAAWSAR